MSKTYISLGPNCQPSIDLKKIGLRKIAFPFDWLYTTPEYGISYVNNLIQTNFDLFLKDLDRDSDGIVYSKNYPHTKFQHHDLIKNRVTNRRDTFESETSNLIDTFKKRANRFLEFISDSNKKIIFLYHLRFTLLLEKEKMDVLIDSLYNLLSTLCEKNNTFQFVLYISHGINEKDKIIVNEFESYITINYLEHTYSIKNHPNLTIKTYLWLFNHKEETNNFRNFISSI